MGLGGSWIQMARRQDFESQTDKKKKKGKKSDDRFWYMCSLMTVLTSLSPRAVRCGRPCALSLSVSFFLYFGACYCSESNVLNETFTHTVFALFLSYHTIHPTSI